LENAGQNRPGGLRATRRGLLGRLSDQLANRRRLTPAQAASIEALTGAHVSAAGTAHDSVGLDPAGQDELLDQVREGLSQVGLSRIDKDAIIAHAKKGMAEYNIADSADLTKDTFNATDQHLSIAYIMDAIYKNYITELETMEFINVIPDDATLIQLYLEAYQGSPFCDTSMKEFSPRAKETMRILMIDFDNFPNLRDIQPQHRWRLIVDPIQVDVLSRHGIDPNNPFLAFIFDSHKEYAFNIAKGWIATAKALQDGRELDLGLVNELRSAGGGGDIPKSATITSFAAAYDNNGRIELAKFLDNSRDNFGFTHCIYTENQFIMIAPGMQNMTALIPSDDSDSPIEFLFNCIQKAKPSNKTLSELLDRKSIGVKHLLSARNNNEIEKMEAALNKIIDNYHRNSAIAKTEYDKILASTTLYHDAENLHPFMDGNFRTFGKFILNFTLARQGEAMTELYDPNRTDGQSSIDNIAEVKKGQKWRAQWTEPGSGDA
jgi:hypothetical protein